MARSCLLVALLLPVHGCASSVAPWDDAAAHPTTADAGSAGFGGIPMGRRVADLTESEAQQWCAAWTRLLEPNGLAIVQATGPDAQGYRDYTAGFSCPPAVFAPPYGVPDITTTDCVANLRVRPCGATIADLESCGLAIHGNRCSNANDSCAALHNRQGCGDTFVVIVDGIHFRIRVQ